MQRYENDLDNSVIVDVGVADGDTDGSDDGVNGALRITAKREGDGDHIGPGEVRRDYLPAYGYYEIRAKLPSEDCAWPAIWLLGDVDNNTWPATGEIDMVEWSSEVRARPTATPSPRATHDRPPRAGRKAGRARSTVRSMTGTPTSCGGHQTRSRSGSTVGSSTRTSPTISHLVRQ